MCDKRASTSSVDEALGKAGDAVWETEEAETPTPNAHRVLISSDRVDSSLAGVIGNESVPDDWEVERDARVEANGVVAREDTALVCLWEGAWDSKGIACCWISLSTHLRRTFSKFFSSSSESGS